MKSLEIGKNLLPAIAYGDACGFPFETKPSQPRGAINGMVPLKRNHFLGIDDTQTLSMGTWSDDTHLSLASALSIVRCGGFDLDDQAALHVEAIKHVKGSAVHNDLVPAIVTKSSRNGYGGSTIQSIERIENGTSPKYSGAPGGAGNGVLMKLAPLAYWHIVRETAEEAVMSDLIEFTKMTHDSPEAVVCSLVHFRVLELLFRTDSADSDAKGDIIGYATKVAEMFESSIDPNAKTSSVFKRLKRSVPQNRDEVLTAVEGDKGGGFYAPETLMMVYGSFVLESCFPNSVYRAVELGGDTDSIGSIAATMSVFLYANVDFPPDAAELYALTRLNRVSAELAKLAIGR